MPYMTRYNLQWSQESPVVDEVATLIATLEHGTASKQSLEETAKHWRNILEGNKEDPWYNHQDHMTKVSQHWPQVLFTLKGNGEEQEDTWVEYHLSGRLQQATAELVYPPFEPALLQRPEYPVSQSWSHDTTTFITKTKGKPMSYYTRYELTIDPVYSVGLTDVASSLATNVDGSPPSDPSHKSKTKDWEAILSGEELGKWHNHEYDLANATVHWKDVIFHLYGRGEDDQDVWTLYCMNGKTHKAHWQMNCEPLDRTKLSEPPQVPT